MIAVPSENRLTRTECGTLWLEVSRTLCGLRCSGALWLEGEGALIAGDLHLEKGSARAHRGALLPPYDTRTTLDALEAELDRLHVRTLILLGDSFHDPRAVRRLAPDDAARIAALSSGRTLIWVEGNHDIRNGESALAGLPGEVVEAVTLAGLRFVHEPRAGLSPGEVAGHLHPAVRVASHGRSVRRRAFLTDGRRLILPAFGAYAGGLNALDPAFRSLFERPPIAAALSDDKVRALPWSSLRPD
ncbi:ligase-associated DNA damage response endonuclease PdeM [soil metagenome]